MFDHSEAVTVSTPVWTVDDYGNRVADWVNATDRAELCGVADAGSTEPLEVDRNAIDADFDLIFDHDPAITAQDRVTVRTLLCEVAGRPFAWRSPFTGWEPGTVVRVKIREG